MNEKVERAIENRLGRPPQAASLWVTYIVVVALLESFMGNLFESVTFQFN
jgi:hypothetical protein